MSRNLITGGLGFLGSYLARHLVEVNEQVVIFDLATDSRLLDDIKNKINIVQGNLVDRAQVLAVVKDNEIDCIYHLGALLPPASEENLATTFGVNVAGTLNVLEAARLFEVGSVIFLSTVATYGSGLPLMVDENILQQPINMYGTTKVCCERLGEQYHRRYGVNFRSLRLPPVLGAGRRDSAQSAFTYLAIREAAKGRPYSLNVERGTRIPSIVYIKDAIAGLISLKLADEKQLKRRIYNIHGFSLSAAELVEEVRKHIPEAQFDFNPDPIVVNVIKNWPALDDTKAREEWGWQSKYQLRESVADFITEVRANTTRYM